MLQLILSVFFLVVAILMVLITINSLIIYPLRTRHVRKHPKLYNFCRFYINDEKCTGKIIRTRPHSVDVEMYNSIGNIKVMEVHRSQIYPTW